MRTKLFVLLVLVSVIFSACAPAPTATVVPATPQKVVETVVQTVVSQVVVTTTPGPNPEAVIQGVEPNATITFWTFWLSPTFDQYIKDTIARFNEAYPGVTVKWEDHQATFQDDLKAAYAAGNAPDVINLSVSEGWVSQYASQGLLLPLDDKVPASVKALYFPGLWKEQLINGVNYQFPWYEGINVDLINHQVYDKTGLKVSDFPKNWTDLPALCATIKAKTGNLCDIRLTTNDLISEMVYEGNVKPISADGKSFTFDSADGVAWLQQYVDMVKANTVDRTVLVTDQDRVGLDLFTSGKAAFYATGPNLIRDVRANNPGLYGYLDVVPAPVGKSGVIGKGLMAISINAKTKYPNASIALAQFFTNPVSMLAFSKIVSIYPSTPASYDDPFFSAAPVAIEDSAKPFAKDAISKYADIVPTIPHVADVNAIVLKHVEDALFKNVPAQKALTDAVTEANALLP
jgi:putative chitobiose transport system substrate-binding protein